LKVEELKMAEINVKKVQTLYHNFATHTKGWKTWLQDFYSSYGACYGNDSPYYPTINEILMVHQELEKLYDIFAENVSRINVSIEEWNKYFAEAKTHLKTRDKYRFRHDHYDDKMSKLVKDRDKRHTSGRREGPKFLQRFERNDVKYRNAAENYARMSKYSYDMMCDVLEYKTKFLNPSLIQLTTQELEYYTACSRLLAKLGDLQQRFNDMNMSERVNRVNYDPFKFIRGKSLISTTGGKVDPNMRLLDEKTSLFKERTEQTGGFRYGNDVPLQGYQVGHELITKDVALQGGTGGQSGFGQTGYTGQTLTGQTGYSDISTGQIGMGTMPSTQTYPSIQTGGMMSGTTTGGIISGTTTTGPIMSGTSGGIISGTTTTLPQGTMPIDLLTTHHRREGFTDFDDEGYAISESEGEVEEDEDYAVNDEGLGTQLSGMNINTMPSQTSGTYIHSQQPIITTTTQQSGLGGIIRGNLQPLEETEGNFNLAGQVSPKSNNQPLSFQEPNLSQGANLQQQSQTYGGDIKQTTTTGSTFSGNYDANISR